MGNWFMAILLVVTLGGGLYTAFIGAKDLRDANRQTSHNGMFWRLTISGVSLLVIGGGIALAAGATIL